MAEKLEFELVSPEKLLVSQPVDMVVIPGAEGDFGVMKEHAPVISSVRPGVIAIFDGDKVTNRIFVAGGFAEVNGDRCTVLAEEAVPVTDIDAAKAQQDVSDFAEDVQDAKTDHERSVAEHKLAVAEAKVAAAAGGPY